MTRTPLLLSLVLAAAASASADEPPVPRLGLRLEPDRPEVYDLEITLEGGIDLPDRRGKPLAFEFATRLAGTVAITPEEPLEGTWPARLAFAAFEASERYTMRHGEEQESHQERFELPELMAGYGSELVVHPSGETSELKLRRLTAPGKLGKRAGIDLWTTSLLGIGRLPDAAERSWEAVTRLVIPGEGWADDFVNLELTERYTVREVTSERITIEAELVSARTVKGGMRFDPAKHVEADGRVSPGRWIQAMLHFGEGELRSSRTIVLDASGGRLLEATHELALSYERAGDRFRFTRRLAVRPAQAAGAALERLRRAAEPREVRYAVTLAARTLGPGAEAPAAEVALDGVVHGKWDAQRGNWEARYERLSVRARGNERDEAEAREVTIPLDGYMVLTDPMAGMVAFQLKYALLEKLVEQGLPAGAVRAALEAAEGALVADEQLPWELQPPSGAELILSLPRPTAPGARDHAGCAQHPIVGANLRRPLAVTAGQVPGTYDLAADAAAGLPALRTGRAVFHPEEHVLELLDLELVTPTSHGCELTVTIRWKRLAPEPAATDGAPR